MLKNSKRILVIIFFVALILFFLIAIYKLNFNKKAKEIINNNLKLEIDDTIGENVYVVNNVDNINYLDLNYQQDVDNLIYNKKIKEKYDEKNPLFVFNPYNTNLTGLYVYFKTTFKCNVKYINTSGHNYKTYTIFEYIDDGHYIATSSEKQLVTNVPGMPEVTLTQNNIEEIKNGEVVFEWKSEEHTELYDYIDNIEGMSLTETNDYLHLNSVIIDPKDNNILVSFRNNSTIMKIDRKTGDIIWSLGGIKDEFGLEDYQKFGYQHCLSFTKEHELMIFDNGDNRPAQGVKTNSRVLKIKLDEVNKKVEKFTEYKLNDVYSMAMGSVQVVDEENDVFLVTYGTGIFTKGPVELIDFKNNVSLFTFNLHSNKMMFSSQKS